MRWRLSRSPGPARGRELTGDLTRGCSELASELEEGRQGISSYPLCIQTSRGRLLTVEVFAELCLDFVTALAGIDVGQDKDRQTPAI